MSPELQPASNLQRPGGRPVRAEAASRRIAHEHEAVGRLAGESHRAPAGPARRRAARGAACHRNSQRVDVHALELGEVDRPHVAGVGHDERAGDRGEGRGQAEQRHVSRRGRAAHQTPADIATGIASTESPRSGVTNVRMPKGASQKLVAQSATRAAANHASGRDRSQVARAPSAAASSASGTRERREPGPVRGQQLLAERARVAALRRTGAPARSVQPAREMGDQQGQGTPRLPTPSAASARASRRATARMPAVSPKRSAAAVWTSKHAASAAASGDVAPTQ